ncbi:hypothetical protein CNMCM5793_000324 [Aspergillus hiratsukae]|uniref:Cyanovirin-N domain-containing protein n=1 Tax=Aspergillus hiratsukae TaxID=1194566 RepID=A0A8H6UT60_9EURO|nr:hypothetical protein CNMCM5793_000324 [Aspergillus hiratsukae]KAF7163289.1 hypothetical protein CNMCM6106_000237 [Aspergillus hiratsukae]
MRFDKSCRNLYTRLENGTTVLIAEAANMNQLSDSRTTLDDFIGNEDGYFKMPGRGFTQSAQNIALEYSEHGPKLSAEMRREDGEWRERQGILLADKLENDEGHLDPIF